MTINNTKDNLYWIEALRVLATFSVIVLHISSALIVQYGIESNLNWFIANVYDSATRFAVPVFLMISGALILPKTYPSIKEYLNKRLARILLPFLFWSIIYIAKELYFRGQRGEFNSSNEILDFIVVSFKNGACFHLWFIYLIIGLYLFFPILSKWLNNSSKRETEYFLVIWLVSIIAALPLVNNYFPKINISYFSGFIGFPVLGYYLSRLNFNFKNKKAIYVLSVLFGIIITILGTYFLTKQDGALNQSFYEYLSLNVILVSAAIFLLFKDFIKGNSKIILFFSKYSYGIYLVHILIIWTLSRFGFNYTFIHPAISIPLTAVLCLILSAFIIYSVNKLPYGKYISG